MQAFSLHFIRTAPQGWSAHPRQKGGDAMTVYEALSVMIAFGTLIILLLSNKKK